MATLSHLPGLGRCRAGETQEGAAHMTLPPHPPPPRLETRVGITSFFQDRKSRNFRERSLFFPSSACEQARSETPAPKLRAGVAWEGGDICRGSLPVFPVSPRRARGLPTQPSAAHSSSCLEAESFYKQTPDQKTRPATTLPERVSDPRSAVTWCEGNRIFSLFPKRLQGKNRIEATVTECGLLVSDCRFSRKTRFAQIVPGITTTGLFLFLFLKFIFIYFERERERERERKSQAGSMLSAQSPSAGDSNPQTVRSRAELKSRVGRLTDSLPDAPPTALVHRQVRSHLSTRHLPKETATGPRKQLLAATAKFPRPV
ncbi:uncharacterized protein LOC123577198 [Leopardus geoffroyi]|uniref:uncharacterized protein LOC123577198 n=1 Tax=Leopardus geoffroyi TaxID=46844 RepID=UPI001E2660F1|nr:uncharacterized protein LOC123577198 [Leopardus geoffroyi]